MTQKLFSSRFSFQKLFKKDPRFILLLTEQSISLFFFSTAHQPSLIRLTHVPIETPANHILSFVKEGPGIPIDIFHDTLDQTLKIEKIPPNLYGLDPYRWLRHKHRSLTAEASFSGSYQYRQKNKTVLFASFQMTPLLLPLFLQLENLPNPLQGVYAFALEQLDVYRQLHLALSPKPAPWLLCVHFEDNGRMRHTVLHEGRFVLSRLFPPLSPGQNPLLQEESSVREIQGTLRYLMKQFSTPAIEIEALFLGKNLQPETFRQFIEKKYWVLSLTKSATLLNIPLPPPDFETLFLARFYSRKSGAFLCLKPQSKGKKEFYGPFQGGNWILAWSLGISLCVGSGIFFFQAQQLKYKIAFFQEKRLALEAHHAHLNQGLAALPVSVEQMREFLSLRQDLDSSSETPLKIFEKLGAILGTQIRLRHLDWQTEAAEDLGNSLTLEAYPVSATLSQKELIHLFDGFLERLKEKFPQSTLDVLHGPYSTHQTQLLTGGLQDETLPPDPTCIVKISW